MKTTRYDHALKMYEAFGNICNTIERTRRGAYEERTGLGHLRMHIEDFLQEYKKFTECSTQVRAPDAYQGLFTSDDFLAYTVFTTNIMKQMEDLVAIVYKMQNMLGFDSYDNKVE